MLVINKYQYLKYVFYISTKFETVVSTEQGGNFIYLCGGLKSLSTKTKHTASQFRVIEVYGSSRANKKTGIYKAARTWVI